MNNPFSFGGPRWINLVKTCIQNDRQYQVNKKWPLVDINEVKKLSEAYKDLKYDNKEIFFVKPPRFIDRRLNFEPDVGDTIRSLFRVASTHMVVAGGYLTNKIFVEDDVYIPNVDIDVFFYGTIEEVNKEFQQVTNYLNNKYGSCCSWSRNKYVVNAIIREPTGEFGNYYKKTTIIQFITKAFPSIDSILGTFDISASAVLYNGLGFLFTPLAAFSYATGSIYIDTTRKSNSFEYRMTKYWNKGFRVVFPELDLTFFNPQFNNLTLHPDYILYGNQLRDQSQEKSGYAKNTFKSVTGLLHCLKHNLLNEKTYIDVDFIGGKFVNPRIKTSNQISRVYYNLIPDRYRRPIQFLRTWYDKETFISLIATYYLDLDSERHNEQIRIRDEYVQSLINKSKSICEKYNQQIDWYCDTDPFGHTVVTPEKYYGQYYRDIGLTIPTELKKVNNESTAEVIAVPEPDEGVPEVSTVDRDELINNLVDQVEELRSQLNSLLSN